MHGYLHLKFDHILFVIIFFAIFLFHNNLGYDIYFHLKTGELITNSGTIPSGDPFSFSAFGKPWQVHEWLFEYAIYNFHSLLGIYGVRFLSAGLTTLSLYIAYSTAVRLSGQWYIAIALAAISFSLYFTFDLQRPQTFTYLFLAVYLQILIGFKYRLYPVKLYLLPILMIVWVNVHGGYIVGLALLFVFTFTTLVENFQDHKAKEIHSTSIKPLLWASALCIAATLINPYTYHHWYYPFYLMSMSANNFIMEWMSPDFHHPYFKLYLYYTFGYLLINNLSNTRPTLTENVVPLCFIFMSFISRRHIPLALIVVLPFYALAFKRLDLQLPRRFDMASSFLKFLISPKMQIAKEGKTIGLNWLLLIAVISMATYLHLITDDRIALYEKDSMPVQAVEFIEKTGIKGNVFNSNPYGGYLIYKLYPQSKVFIDGRMDMYGDMIDAKFRTIAMAGKGWKELLDSYPIDYILIENAAPINQHINETEEFKLVYRDMRDSLYVRNDKQFHSVIERFEHQVAPLE